MELVSVIIPIYNMEKYVERCVESVLRQDYDNIEILLVNDGSTDTSLNLIKEKYASIEKCKIITKKNGGLASARNAGLEVAKGDFIYFLDADDYIDKYTISSLVKCMLEYNADFCCHRTASVDEEYHLLGITGSEYDFECLDNKDSIIKESLLIRNIKAAVTLKMWKRSFVESNHLRFLEGVIHEDILFSVKASLHATRVAFLNKPLYFVLSRHSSISRTMKARNITDYFVLFDEMRNYMQQLSCFTFYEKYYYACYCKCILFNLFISTLKISSLDAYRNFFSLLKDNMYMDKSKGKSLLLISKKYYWLYRLSLYPSLFYLFGLLSQRCNKLNY